MEWFEDIFKTYYQDIYKYVYVLSADKSIVEDIAQDVFMTLYRKRHRLTDHPFIKGWLYTTARNIISEHMKKRSKRIKYEFELSAQALIKTYHVDIVPYNGYEVLSEFLTDKEIELIRLNKEYGFTVKEIAASKGKHYSALSKMMWRIKQKIKAALQLIICIIISIIRGLVK